MVVVYAQGLEQVLPRLIQSTHLREGGAVKSLSQVKVGRQCDGPGSQF